MITHLVLGPPQHGVTRHGAALAGPHRIDLSHVGDGAVALNDVLQQSDSPIHVHLTDHLLGDDNDAVVRGVEVLEQATRPVHVTLHDIPQPDEGDARFERRRDIYRRLVALAASVQVCSETEGAALAEMAGVEVDEFGVVHLPIDLDPVAPAERWRDGPLGVLGFVHPGKNPELAVAAGAAVGRDVEMLGAVGPGHDDLARDLATQARRGGIDCVITGHLGEAEMDARIAHVAVPIAPYRHVSASGSIGRWIAAGRRPVVVATPWARELADRAPWALTVVEMGAGDEGPDHFVAAVRDALDEPETTWWSEPGTGLLTTSQAAQRQAELLERHGSSAARGEGAS